MKLKNKVVLVTGVSPGIRDEIAKLIAKEGASVVVLTRKNEKTNDLIKHIKADGGKALAVPRDPAEDDLQNATNAAICEFGRLDIVINSAGIADIIAPVADIGEGIWEVDLKVDITGTI